MTVYIYGLVCPLSGATRYIGKSIEPEKRFIAHIGGALRSEYNHHTARWIRKLHADGLRPTLVILEAVQPDQDWRVVERDWIEKAKQAGWPITNTTAGGEGLDYLDPADKAKYKANLSAAMKRRAASPEGRAQLAEMKAAGMTAEAYALRSEAMKKAWSDPDMKSVWDAALEKTRTDPTALRKKVASLKANWSANRDQMVAKIWTPETRAKQSAGRKASWADPETRERLMNRWTPEARAKQAEELAKRQAKIQAARTPEVRAKQAAALKATWAKRKAAKLAATVE